MIWGPNPNAAKTFILQFIYKGGNGWAFVNAPTINKAVEIFTSQTKFKEAHVTNIKETKYYGQNIQICFEGAVTTTPIIANEITVDKEFNSNSYNPIANAVVAGKFKSFTDKFSAIYDKNEINALLREKINKNDLSRVAFSGSYKDLSDMPYIPPAYDDTDIKARITELEEAGFITDFTEQDPTVPDWAKSPHKPTYTASEVGALPDSIVIPVIPTKVSAFTNDVGYLTSFTEVDPTVPAYIKAITQQDIANWNSKTSNIGTITSITMNGVSKGTSGVVDLGTVLTSHQSLAGYATTQYVDDAFNNLIGSAPAVLDTLEELAAALGEDENFATTITNQLSNKVDKESGKGLSTNDYTTTDKDKLAGIAAGAEVNVNADWNATSGDAQILNKPTLFSGDYNDLINKPSIPSGYDDTGLSNRVSAVETGLQSKAEASNVYTKSEVDSKTAKTTARGDNKLLYNGQTVEAAIANVGISSSNNLLNNGFNMAIRSNNSNPFFGLKEGNNLWYAQAASNYFYFGPTSTKAFRLDQAGNGVFQTGSVTANSFIRNGGTSAQFLKADGSVDTNTYLTQHQDISGKVNYTDLASVATSGSYNDLQDKPNIPAAYNDTALSNRITALENAGFLTTETDPTVPAWAKSSTKPSYTASEVGALPDTTVIPTKTSQLNNDSGFLTSHQDISGKQDVLTAGDGIAINNNTVRTTGIPFGRCDSTSTSTVFTATVPGIYKLEDGVCCMIDNGVVTSASGFTLNVNGLGAKPVYNSMAAATRDTTIFNADYTMLFVYDETRVSGGCWVCYRGYDANTNTIGYQLRTNNTVRNVSDTARYYKIYFTSADGTKWVPASVNSTNNATAARPVNQRPIDPFGRIVYTSANTNYAAGANLTATTIWDQYNLTLGYSFNRTGAALTLTSEASVYLKCAPQTDGSAIMDADTPIVQALPTTNDGKIYIFLGVATSATAIELVPHHPVYYHDGTGIRMWTGSTGGGSTDLSNYYTKTEIDTMIGDIETLLAST